MNLINELTSKYRIKPNINFITRQVNKCDDPVSVTTTMDVPDLRIAWSHTYISDDIVEVPGFTASLPSVSAGVYVQVALTPKGDELRLTVGTSCRTWMWSFHSVYSQTVRGLEI